MGFILVFIFLLLPALVGGTFVGAVILAEIVFEIASWIADKVTGVPGHNFKRDFYRGKPNKEGVIK